MTAAQAKQLAAQARQNRPPPPARGIADARSAVAASAAAGLDSGTLVLERAGGGMATANQIKSALEPDGYQVTVSNEAIGVVVQINWANA